jgi:hypothetical protein
MLRKKTVFVIGAGASSEFNLPVGVELAKKISEKLNVKFSNPFDDSRGYHQSGDHDLFDSVRRAFPEQGNHYHQAGLRIRDAVILASSIDDFLHVHRHDQRVVNFGKAAIVKCILEAEQSSKLYFSIRNSQSTISFGECADTWLVKLMRLLVRNRSHGDRANFFDQSAFVIFNYDRCIEHFFIHALSKFYSIPPEEGAEIVSSARFYHPYGTPGLLNKVSFGIDRADWANLANEIKTYTETVEAGDIKRAIREAEQIVFLGFAYHDQNMSLLADDDSLPTKTIVGTAYKRSDSDVRAISAQIAAWGNSNSAMRANADFAIRNDLTASDIFDYFSKSL